MTSWMFRRIFCSADPSVQGRFEWGTVRDFSMYFDNSLGLRGFEKFSRFSSENRASNAAKDCSQISTAGLLNLKALFPQWSEILHGCVRHKLASSVQRWAISLGSWSCGKFRTDFWCPRLISALAWNSAWGPGPLLPSCVFRGFYCSAVFWMCLS